MGREHLNLHLNLNLNLNLSEYAKEKIDRKRKVRERIIPLAMAIRSTFLPSLFFSSSPNGMVELERNSPSKYPLGRKKERKEDSFSFFDFFLSTSDQIGSDPVKRKGYF